MLLEVVDEVAEDLIARGAATLEEEWDGKSLGWDGPTLRLRPHNPAAASIELGAALDATFVVIGEHQLQLELWDPWPEARRQPLRDCLRAIADGRVRGAREPHWSGPRETLVIETEPEPVVVHWYRALVDSGPETWAVSYEPY